MRTDATPITASQRNPLRPSQSDGGSHNNVMGATTKQGNRRDAIRAIVDTAPPVSAEQLDVIDGILRHGPGIPAGKPPYK
jgi:hypothetical protein